jgi:hypothetical protein
MVRALGSISAARSSGTSRRRNPTPDAERPDHRPQFRWRWREAGGAANIVRALLRPGLIKLRTTTLNQYGEAVLVQVVSLVVLRRSPRTKRPPRLGKADGADQASACAEDRPTRRPPASLTQGDGQGGQVSLILSRATSARTETSTSGCRAA